MKKKNMLVMALSLALIAVVAVSGTLAYFTDKTDTKTNTFATGKVAIDLHDETNDASVAATENGLNYMDVVPGDKLNKQVYVTVDKNSSDSYVAVRLAFESKGAKPTLEEMYKLVTVAMDKANTTANWTCLNATDGTSDLIFVANGANNDSVIKAGETLKLFDEIQIPAAWGNEYAEAQFSITASAYAIQADNVTTDMFVNMINGLPIDVDGTSQVVPFEQVG